MAIDEFQITTRFTQIELSEETKFDLEYTIVGEGEPLIFVPGARVDFHHLRPILQQLSKFARVYVLRFPDHKYIHFFPALHAEIYHQVIDAFATAMQLDKYSLVGQSLGGGLVLSYAATFPDRVEKVVSISPIVFPDRRSLFAGYYALWKGIKQRTHMEHSNKSLSEIFTNFLHWRTTTRVIKMFREFDTTPYLAKLRKPVLFFIAGQDLLVPVHSQLKAAGLVENSQLEFYPDIGHSLIHMQAEEIALKISAFLKSQ